METKLIKFLKNQINNADSLIRPHLTYEDASPRPRRSVFYELENYLHKFLNQKSTARSFILTGLRGAGKTTLLSQLYSSDICKQSTYKLYLSVDRIVKELDSSLIDILEAYESIIDTSFERLDKPLILFLDEIHYDPKWGIILKSLFDRSNKIFIFATGSSALFLQSNADLARRANFKKIFPLNFTEYAEIKHKVKIEEELQTDIFSTIFESKSAEDVFENLSKYQNKTLSYWSKLERFELDRYIRYGSLPFTLSIDDEMLIYEQIQTSLSKIIHTDMQEFEQFSTDILKKVPSLLYSIADSDQVSISKLAETLSINRHTVSSIIDSLEKAEALIKIYPYASNTSQIRKVSKYLFSAPVLRSMYFHLFGSVQSNFKGKLYEDTIVMYLNRLFFRKINFSINYDGSSKGADFIVNLPSNEKIILEVGSGKKDFSQVKHSQKKVKAKYSLNISNSELKISKDKTAVNVPLEYFLLI